MYFFILHSCVNHNNKYKVLRDKNKARFENKLSSKILRFLNKNFSFILLIKAFLELINQYDKHQYIKKQIPRLSIIKLNPAPRNPASQILYPASFNTKLIPLTLGF